MPPTTPGPQDPKPSAPPAQSGAGHVDFDKLILPSKSAPSVDSAQRINAGLLFEQEQNASLPTPPKPEAPAPTPKEEQPLVKPLQTYQGDIESLVGEKQVSVVSIAAAEANRRGLSKLQDSVKPLAEAPRKPWLRKTLFLAAGAALLVLSLGVAAYIYLRLQPVPISQQSPAPFILVDDTQTIEIEANDTRGAIMDLLLDARRQTALALGLVTRLQIAKPTALNDGSLQEVGAPEFLQLLVPRIPPELVRTLEPAMLLGVHSFDENQAFLILKADSYETAYSGMLAWESNMQADLSPLFSRTPAVRPRAQPAAPSPAPAASTTATTTPGAGLASTTASTTEAAAGEPIAFFQGNFLDQIVENRDARVILNQDGEILLLWTFLDRSTIVVTTNSSTLKEVISRVSQASILSLPAQ